MPKNKIEIIPAVLTKTYEQFTEKVNAVENLVNWVQLDVADGNFAPSTSWGDPVAIHNFDPGVFMEAHLMVSEPENVIDEWITGESEEGDSGIKRIFFHYEATSKHEEILEKIKNAGKEAGIAILPETPVHLIEPFAGLLDAVLIFSGNLGFYGGKFNEEASISKISTLRNKYPDITIEVDGGMNPETAKKVVDAGANAIVSGSYIWGSKDIKEAIDQLQNAVTL